MSQQVFVDLNLNDNKITTLGDPFAPGDATNVRYVREKLDEKADKNHTHVFPPSFNGAWQWVAASPGTDPGHGHAGGNGADLASVSILSVSKINAHGDVNLTPWWSTMRPGDRVIVLNVGRTARLVAVVTADAAESTQWVEIPVRPEATTLGSFALDESVLISWTPVETTSYDEKFVNVGGDTMRGTLDMDGNTVANVADPVNPTDAVNLQSLTTATALNLDDLADVDTAGVQDNNVVVYDSSASGWVAAPAFEEIWSDDAPTTGRLGLRWIQPDASARYDSASVGHSSYKTTIEALEKRISELEKKLDELTRN